MKFKKIGVLVLALALVLSTQLTSFAANGFTDINESPYKEDIQLLYNNGIVGGVGQGEFAPDRVITNAESIQLLNSYLHLSLAQFTFIKAPEVTDYYNIATNEGWYQDALIIAAVNGLPVDQNLLPNAAIDRETFYYLLVKGLEAKYDFATVKVSPVEISDNDQLTPDKQGAIQRALSMGLASLDENEAFRPHETLTREEAAHVIADTIWYMEGFVPNDTPQDLPESTDDAH